MSNQQFIIHHMWLINSSLVEPKSLCMDRVKTGFQFCALIPVRTAIDVTKRVTSRMEGEGWGLTEVLRKPSAMNSLKPK